MKTELFSLSKIFSENVFRIPDYQRGYSWTEREVLDFWNDVQILASGADHYTGVLTLEEAAPEQYASWDDDAWIIESKRFKPYYVVDGQQRLTTALILLQGIIERIGPEGTLNYTSVSEIRKKFIYDARPNNITRTYIFGYEKDNPSREFLKTRIFGEMSAEYSAQEETIYTHNLETAKRFFVEQLRNLAEEEVAVVYKKLTQHLLFNIYTMTADINVFIAFETMNNRGRLLSGLELLKTRLIFLSTKMQAEPVDVRFVRHAVNECWKTVYHYLGKNKANPLNDDVFLRNHFSLYFGRYVDQESPLARPAWQRELLLDRIFSVRNIDGGVHTPEVHQDRNTLVRRRGQNTPSDLRNAPPPIPRVTIQTINEYASDLKNMVELFYSLHNPAQSDLPDDDQLALNRLARLGWFDATPLALAALSARKPESAKSFTKLLRALEIITFRRYFFGRFHRDDVNFTTCAIDIRSNPSKLNEFADQLGTLSGETLRVDDRLPHRIPMHNFYDWRGLSYMLFEYELELRRKARKRADRLAWADLLNDDLDGEVSTVEHVFPQNAPLDAWPTFRGLTAKQRNALCHSLGNLVPLSQAKNRALGSRDFRSKCEGGDGRPGYRVGSYSEIEVSRFEDWTPSTIAERGVRILGFAEKRWHLNFGDHATKLRTLGLHFLSDVSSGAGGGGPADG